MCLISGDQGGKAQEGSGYNKKMIEKALNIP